MQSLIYIQTSDREELLNNIKMCDIIIYDIISDPSQVDEASWVVSGMISIIPFHFITVILLQALELLLLQIFLSDCPNSMHCKAC